MRTYTKPKEIPINVDILDHALNWCKDDKDLWSLALISGMTTVIKPSSSEEEKFYDAEVMAIAEIAERGVSNSQALQNRRNL
jgi:hypothetical protein